MSYSLENKLVVGVSARTLFDLCRENEIYENEGLDAYLAYQTAHEKVPMYPGPGFRLIKALLGLNEYLESGRIEVIIMSHNSPDISVRIFNSVAHYGLDISRAVMVSGSSLVPYLEAFGADLFLSSREEDVQSAVDCGIAAGVIYMPEGIEKDTAERTQKRKVIYPLEDKGQIRIAFDGDAVLFTEESERIFQEKGLDAFQENERRCVDIPLEPGPFARFLMKLTALRKECPEINDRIRTALVTSRCAPAHERVIRTLRSWNVTVDEAFFLGGISKKEILRAFGAHIFFDDQQLHLNSASAVVPVARVPYRRRKREQNEIQSSCTG